MPKTNGPISYKKCQKCRKDKQKCLPEIRDWPARRCNRCEKYDYECSANVKKAHEGLEPVRSSIINPTTPQSSDRTPLGEDCKIDDLLSELTIKKFLQPRLDKLPSSFQETWEDEDCFGDLEWRYYNEDRYEPLRHMILEKMLVGDMQSAFTIIAQLGQQHTIEHDYHREPFWSHEADYVFGRNEEILHTWALLLTQREHDVQQLVHCISALEFFLSLDDPNSEVMKTRLLLGLYDKLQLQIDRHLPNASSVASVALLAGVLEIKDSTIQDYMFDRYHQSPLETQIMSLCLLIATGREELFTRYCSLELPWQSDDIDPDMMFSQLAADGSAENIKQLAAKGYDLKQKAGYNDRRTLIHQAILRRDTKQLAEESTLEFLRELVRPEHGIDLEARDEDGDTALDFAVKYEFKAVEELLRSAIVERQALSRPPEAYIEISYD